MNVNKVATLRNSRGGEVPSVRRAVEVCLEAGAPGITVHPRADARHITPADVHEIAGLLGRDRGGVELNIEGDPRPDLLDLVRAVRPDQCTLVPVQPGEVTSQAGWPPDAEPGPMQAIVSGLRRDGIRVSLFVNPDVDAVRWAAQVGADRVELYTEPFARAWQASPRAGEAALVPYITAAEHARALGLGINAGHDLNLDNLVRFRRLPGLEEVSIGHALISHAVFVGLERAVRDYLAVLEGGIA